MRLSAWILAPLIAATQLDATAAGQGTDDKRDTVTMKNGKTLEGRIVLVTHETIYLLVGTREREIDRQKVATIDSVALHLRKIQDGYRKDNGARSAGQMVDFAERCNEAQLTHDAELFYWRALLLNPDHEPARTALGHEKRGGEWKHKVGGRWRTLEKAGEFHANWNDALELRSEHFEVRCSTGLERTLDTLFELEFAYRYFLDLFQEELELREVAGGDPIRVYVYRDRKQFPAAASNVGAFFSTAENILYTYVAGQSRPTALFHEATHAILFNTAERAAKSRGKLPAWLDEGWAEYMEGILVPEGDGRVKIDRRRRLLNRLEAIRVKDTFSLQRVLNFKSSDYGASSKQLMKYGQGYALFIHMLETREYRARFFDYLREAFAGKGQASKFRKIFRRELKAIEKGHLAVR